MTFRGINLLDGKVPGELICASGIVPDVIYGTKFGRNLDVDGPEDITSAGGDYTGQPLLSGSPLGTEENFELISTDANDTAGGTGARSVRFNYLDDNGDWSWATVALNGTTGVDTGISGIRCFRSFVPEFGSSGANAGTITVRHITTTSRIFTEIMAGAGQSEVAAMTVPRGHVGVFSRPLIKPDRVGGVVVDASFRTRNVGQNGYLRKNVLRASNDSASFSDDVVISLPELSDIKLRVEAVSAINTDVAGQFNYMMFKQ